MMIRSILLLAAVQAAAAQDLITDIPTLTRHSSTFFHTFTPTSTGPNTTVTIPILGMQQTQYTDHPGSWYASVIGYDADIDATTIAAGFLIRDRDPDDVDLTITYGAVSAGYVYAESENDLESEQCEENFEMNALVCQSTSDGEVRETAVAGLSDMIVPVTITGGLEYLEGGTPEPTETPSSEEEQEDEGEGGDDGSGEEDGAGAVAVGYIAVVGTAFVAALELW